MKNKGAIIYLDFGDITIKTDGRAVFSPNDDAGDIDIGSLSSIIHDIEKKIHPAFCSVCKSPMHTQYGETPIYIHDSEPCEYVCRHCDYLSKPTPPTEDEQIQALQKELKGGFSACIIHPVDYSGKEWKGIL